MHLSRRTVGWLAMAPMHNATFSGLNSGQALQTADVDNPRLVILACPKQFWKQCHRIHQNSPNSPKQKVKVLRQRMEPFGKLAGSIFERQLANDLDFLIECPLVGRIGELHSILTLESVKRVHLALSHLCRFRHQASKREPSTCEFGG